LLSSRCGPFIPLLIQILRMLLLMTVQAQKLPVAPVRRIVVVIVILVMDRELADPLARKFPPAPCTDPREYLERPFPILFLSSSPAAPRLGNDPIHFVSI